MEKSSSSSSWSDLPQPLVELILEHLPLPDHLRFGCVCRPWRIVQTQCPHPPAPQLPFLFLPPSLTRRSIELFSLSEKRIYKTPLPDSLDCLSFTCISSSHGWLLLKSLQGSDCVREYGHIFLLFHPLINDGGNNHIRLPNEVGGSSYMGCLFFATPSDPHGILFVNSSIENSVLLYRLGDPDRKPIFRRICEECTSSNFVFYQGKLYVMYYDWSLIVLDFTLPDYTINVVFLELAPGADHHPLKKLFEEVCVLVESCGELLLVVMKMKHGNSRGLSFDVFRADLTKKEWVKVEDLGDRTLFFNKRSAASVCASQTGCKGNRIYYAPNADDKVTGLFMELNGNYQGAFVEFELGRDGITVPSTPQYICPRFSFYKRREFTQWIVF